MDEYDHEYRHYMYLIENYTDFEKCIRDNAEIIPKIPKILEVIAQEMLIAEKMMFLYNNRYSSFEIPKSNTYALNYFNYLKNNILYNIYCKNCLDMNILELKNHYYFELNVERAPIHRHELFNEYIDGEFSRYIKILYNLKKIRVL
ncbi:hypothetical protein [Methanococcus sp. CF]